MNPGVVLLDLDLDLGRGPDGAVLDGTTLIAGLRRTGWRVVVLSATHDEARVGRALSPGALACVPKTAALPVLTTTVRRALQGVDVMHPGRRQYLVDRYRELQAQARAIGRGSAGSPSASGAPTGGPKSTRRPTGGPKPTGRPTAGPKPTAAPKPTRRPKPTGRATPLDATTRSHRCGNLRCFPYG